MANNMHVHINHQMLLNNIPDQKKAEELLMQFQLSLQEEIAKIAQALQAGQWEVVKTYVHRIRSGSLYLGIESIGEIATEFDEMMESGTSSSDKLSNIWEQLESRCQALIECTQPDLVKMLTRI